MYDRCSLYYNIMLLCRLVWLFSIIRFQGFCVNATWYYGYEFEVWNSWKIGQYWVWLCLFLSFYPFKIVLWVL